MATIGVEYVDEFSNVRAAGVISGGGQDLSCPYYIGRWFGGTLKDAGHTWKEFHVNLGVAEHDMRDVPSGGNDRADSVDLWFIITHGNYANGQLSLLFDTKKEDFFGRSKDWHFGDTCNLEWLWIYGCHSINGDNILEHLGIFKGLHLICGSYGDMYDSWTIDEVGEDTANNLLCGHPVSESWLDGVSDWWVSNHPMVISVETKDTFNDGDPDYSTTVIGSDHLWGEGVVRADIPPNKQFWMQAFYDDGGIYG